MFENDIVISEFRQGASHKPEEVPCQDYARSYGDEQLKVVTLSDGHGGAKYFRSQEGSRIASEVGMEALKRFCSKAGGEMTAFLDAEGDFIQQGPIDSKEVVGSRREYVMRHLFQHICSEWHRRIRLHFDENPLTDAERDYLASISTTDYYLTPEGAIIDRHLPSAYGCTLMAVAATPDFWIGLHIGDGKCLAFEADGEWSEPIPWDEKCFLNKTTSLSSYDFDSFRYCIGRHQPAAVVIASDGMDDSYQPMEALADAYANYFFWPLLVRGEEKLKEALPAMLDRISEIGSKDDMSVAMIVDGSRLAELCENFIKRTISILNEELANKEDTISDLNTELRTTEAKINGNQAVIEGYQDEEEKFNKDIAELENRYNEIEERRLARSNFIKKISDAYQNVKNLFKKKDKDIELQLEACEKEGRDRAMEFDKVIEGFNKATTENKQLTTYKRAVENKILRIEEEKKELDDRRKELSERLDKLRNAQEA